MKEFRELRMKRNGISCCCSSLWLSCWLIILELAGPLCPIARSQVLQVVNTFFLFFFLTLTVPSTLRFLSLDLRGLHKKEEERRGEALAVSSVFVFRLLLYVCSSIIMRTSRLDILSKNYVSDPQVQFAFSFRIYLGYTGPNLSPEKSHV